MSRKYLSCAILVACVGILLTGCMPKMTIEEMKAKMPERPAELDKLNAFIGKWQYEGKAHMPMLKDQESLMITGEGEYVWEGDKWYMVGRGDMEMEHFDRSQGLEAWTYDVRDKKYRAIWVESMGMSGIGEVRYDEKANTWHMKATSYGPSGKSTAKGWLKFTDPDTMEWWFAEHQGLMKTAEMSGTAKRVK